MPKRTVKGSGKKMPLNMRTTAALRAKINRAAGASGRSLVQEVEHRIERSFLEDEYVERMRNARRANDDAENLIKRLIEVLMENPMIITSDHREALRDILMRC